MSLLPGTWWLYLAAAGVVATTSSVSTWKFQEIRYGNKEKDRVQAELVATQEFAKNESKRQQNVIDAFNLSRARETALRTDAAATRDTYSGMLISSSAAAERAKASHAACLIATSTFKAVYDSCAGRYTELGETAQRHVNDIQVMQDSWPK